MFAYSSMNLIHLCEHEDLISTTNNANINWMSYSETNININAEIEHQVGIDNSTNNAYWRKGYQSKYESLTYSYQMETNIIQALICQFTPSSNPKNSFTEKLTCLCVLEVSRITAFSTTGEIYNISLPFPVKRIWPSPFGLLLQRLPSENEISSVGNQIISGSELPVLFSLTHPLNEPCHVLYKYSTKEDAIVNALCDSHFEIIHVNNNPSYLITYDSKHNQHNVWEMLLATHRDIPTNTNITQMDDFIGVPKSSQMSSSAPPRTKHFEVTPFNSPFKLYTPSPVLQRKQQHEMESVHTPIPLATSILKSRGDSFAMSDDRYQRINTRRNINSSTSSIAQKSTEFGSGRITRKTSNIKLRNNNLITHICNSRLGAGSATRKKTKSLSPNNSVQKSLSIVCPTTISEYSYPFDELSEPVQPEICLLNLFSENFNANNRNEYLKASTAFYCKNLINQEFLAFVMSDISEIHLRQINNNNNNIEFGSLQTIYAKYAVPLTNLNLILCMHTEAEPLTLYSGTVLVGNIIHDVPSLPVKFYDHFHDQISITMDDNTTHRFLVTSFTENVTINYALEAFQHMLPIDVTHCIYIDVYTNLIQIRAKTHIDTFLNYIRFILNINAINNNNNIISSDDNDDEDWKYLQSFIHLYARKNPVFDRLNTGLINNKAVVNTSEKINTKMATKLSKEDIISIFYALHLTLEEISLDNNLYYDVTLIIQLLVDVCKCYALPLTYLEYYFTLEPSLYSSASMQDLTHTRSAVLSNAIKQLPSSPPSISVFLRDWLIGKYPAPYKCIFSVHTSSCMLIYLYILILSSKCVKTLSNLEKILIPLNKNDNDHKIQNILIQLLRNENIMDRIPLFMIEMKITKNYLLSFPTAYILPIYNAIDICKQNPSTDFNTMAYFLIDRPDLAFQSAEDKTDINKIFNSGQSKSSKLWKPRDQLVSRFESENCKEAFTLVDSSVPITIDLVQKREVTDEEFMEEQSSWLSKHLNRTLALPTGRGMITYGTYSPIPTEKIIFPEFNFTGSIHGSSIIINTPNIDKQSKLLTWPAFHNGVASGLTLNPKIDFVDSSWIQFNNPGDEKSNEFAGYLMAMGLQGHLTNLSKFVMHELLSKNHELIPVGLLLGISAAKKGSMDQDLTRMLSIHVHSLQPESSMELEISPIVQISAILSVGLLYQGSGNRHIVDVLMNEIERISGSDMESIFDRKCRCLSAGFGLGLSLLGFGSHKSHLPIREISERLCRNISADDPNFHDGKINKSQLILDLGIDIMSFGLASIMALTLIYMKSNVISIANFMKPPNSLYKLYECQPFILFQKALSYCLIQWDSITATQDWLLSIVPSNLITRHANDWKELPEKIEDSGLSNAYYTLLASCVFAVGLKYVSSHNEDAFKFLLEYLQTFLKDKKKLSQLTYNLCVNCTLLACSLIMCGTGNSTLLHLLRQFRNIALDELEETGYGNQLAIHMSLGFLFLGNCQYSIPPNKESIAYLLISLYPIFPLKSDDNIYHLQAFRHIYALGMEKRLLIAELIHNNNNDNDKKSQKAIFSIIYDLDSVEYSKEVTLPYLVPQSFAVKSIQLKSENFWPVKIEGTKEYFDKFFQNGGTLYLLSKNTFEPLKFLAVSEWEQNDVDGSNFIGNVSLLKFMSYKPALLSLVYNNNINNINNNNNINNYYYNYNDDDCRNCVFDLFDKNLLIYSLFTNQHYLFSLLLQLKLNVDEIIKNRNCSLRLLLQFVFLYYFYHPMLSEKSHSFLQEYVKFMDMKLYIAVRQQLISNRGELADDQLMKLYKERKYFRINKEDWNIIANRLCYGHHDRQ